MAGLKRDREVVYFIEETFEYQRYWADVKDGGKPGFYSRLLPTDLAAIRSKSNVRSEESSVAAQVASQLTEAIPRTRKVITVMATDPDGKRRRKVLEGAAGDAGGASGGGNEAANAASMYETREPDQDEDDFEFLRTCEAQDIAPVRQIDRSPKRALKVDEDGWEYAPDFPHFDRAKHFEGKTSDQDEKEWFLTYLTTVEGVPKQKAIDVCIQLVSLENDTLELHALAAAGASTTGAAATDEKKKSGLPDPMTPRGGATPRASIFGGGGPMLFTDSGGLKSPTGPAAGRPGGGGGGGDANTQDDVIVQEAQKQTALKGPLLATLSLAQLRKALTPLLPADGDTNGKGREGHDKLKRIFEKVLENVPFDWLSTSPFPRLRDFVRRRRLLTLRDANGNIRTLKSASEKAEKKASDEKKAGGARERRGGVGASQISAEMAESARKEERNKKKKEEDSAKKAETRVAFVVKIAGTGAKAKKAGANAAAFQRYNEQATEQLWDACESGDYKEVVKLLSRANNHRKAETIVEIDGKSARDNGETALIKAAKNGHYSIVKKLLEARIGDEMVACNVNVHDGDGFTPLMAASMNGHFTIVRLLFELGSKCDVNWRDRDGWTALMFAASRGHWHVVEYLAITHRADVVLPSQFSETPLMIACASGYLNIVRFLAEETRAAETFEELDVAENTAIFIAALHGRPAVVEYLASRGADTEKGVRPLDTIMQLDAYLKEFCVIHRCEIIYRDLRDMFIARSGEAKRRALQLRKARQGIDQKAVEAAAATQANQAAQAAAASGEKEKDDPLSGSGLGGDAEITISDEFRSYELDAGKPQTVTKPWTGFRDLVNLTPLELRIMFELFKSEQKDAAAKRLAEMRVKLVAIKKQTAQLTDEQKKKGAGQSDPAKMKAEFEKIETKRARTAEEFQLKHIWLLYKDFKRVGKTARMVRMRAIHDGLSDKEDPFRNEQKLHEVTTDLRDDITRMVEVALRVGRRTFEMGRDAERRERHVYNAWRREQERQKKEAAEKKAKEKKDKDKGVGPTARRTPNAVPTTPSSAPGLMRQFSWDHAKGGNGPTINTDPAAAKKQPDYKWLDDFHRANNVQTASPTDGTNPAAPQSPTAAGAAPAASGGVSASTVADNAGAVSMDGILTVMTRAEHDRCKQQLAKKEYQKHTLLRLRKAERYIQDANVEYRRSQQVVSDNAEWKAASELYRMAYNALETRFVHSAESKADAEAKLAEFCTTMAGSAASLAEDLELHRHQLENKLLCAAADSCFEICEYLLNEWEAMKVTTPNISTTKLSLANEWLLQGIELLTGDKKAEAAAQDKATPVLASRTIGAGAALAGTAVNSILEQKLKLAGGAAGDPLLADAHARSGGLAAAAIEAAKSRADTLSTHELKKRTDLAARYKQLMEDRGKSGKKLGPGNKPYC